MLTDHYQTLARGLPADVVRFVNLPLLELDGEPGALESWITRTQRVGDAGSVVGYTSWVGKASHSRSALAAHCFGVRLHRAHNLEENWGLTWTDPGHAQPHTPVFHALLALGLGSGTCSVYTACATEHWDARIDLDPDALRREGLDPAMYGRPYCPHTPLREDGTTTPNAVGLRMLRDFVRRHGPAFGGYRADIRLLIDLSAAEAGAWVQQGTRSRNVVLEVAELALDLMIQQQYQVDVITTHTSPSPAAEPDTPWIVLLGDPPDPEALDLVRERLGAGGRVLILSSASGPSVPLATTATAGRTTDAVLPHLPRPGHWHLATDDGLVPVRAGSTSRPSTVFALKPERSGRRPAPKHRRAGNLPRSHGRW